MIGVQPNQPFLRDINKTLTLICREKEPIYTGHGTNLSIIWPRRISPWERDGHQPINGNEIGKVIHCLDYSYHIIESIPVYFVLVYFSFGPS